MHPGEDDRPTVDLGPRGPDDDGGTVEDLGPPDPVHALPTQALPPRKKSPTDSHHTKYTTTTSPAEAMRLDEIARSKVFLRVAILTCFAGVLVALITNGDPIAFRVVCAGCGPDPVEAQQCVVGEGRDRDPVTDRRNAADGEAGFVANITRVGAFQHFASQPSGLGEVELIHARNQEQIKPAAGFALEHQ